MELRSIALVLALGGALMGCERAAESDRGRAAGEPALEPGTTTTPEHTAPDTVSPGATGGSPSPGGEPTQREAP